MTDTVLRLPQVRARTGLSRSTIYAKVGNKEFPAPIPLSARAVGWLDSEVQRWLEGCVAERGRFIPKVAA